MIYEAFMPLYIRLLQHQTLTEATPKRWWWETYAILGTHITAGFADIVVFMFCTAVSAQTSFSSF